MERALAIGLTLIVVAAAQAKLVTQTIEYKHDQLTLKGYLAYDDAASGKRPGVLVVHEWWGCNEYARKRAEQLAGLGYVALAVDMYGEGVTTSDPNKAGELAGQARKDVEQWRARVRAGLDALVKQEQCDPKRVAAIGYCFGGSTVLQLAFSGADVAGVVSFHGSLMPPKPDDKIKAKILVLHGADDPMVPAEAISAFQEGLRKAGADWQMTYYGKAVHSFTNPGADAVGIDGVRYDRSADLRSWQAMRQFFNELFETPNSGAK
ncbi:MAG: dienelactone hydrolase family protein [Phycisphaerae bacterium]